MGTNEHLRPLAVRAGRECDWGAGVQSWGVEGGRPSGHLGVSVLAAFSPAPPRSAQGLGGLTPLLHLCLTAMASGSGMPMVWPAKPQAWLLPERPRKRQISPSRAAERISLQPLIVRAG